MEKELILERTREGLLARLPADIDHHGAKSMRERIDRAVLEHMPRRLILDFSAVVFMDSSGVGLVIGRVENAKKYGVSVELRGARDGIMRLMRICGIEKISELSITP